MAEKGQSQGGSGDEVAGLAQEEVDENSSPFSEEVERLEALEAAVKGAVQLLSSLTDVITQQQIAILALQDKLKGLGVTSSDGRLAVVVKDMQGLRAKMRVHETQTHGIQEQ